jgi:hypothetical protein
MDTTVLELEVEGYMRAVECWKVLVRTYLLLQGRGGSKAWRADRDVFVVGKVWKTRRIADCRSCDDSLSHHSSQSELQEINYHGWEERKTEL